MSVRKLEINILKANLLSLGLLVVVAGILIPLYYWIWGTISIDNSFFVEFVRWALDYFNIVVGSIVAVLCGAIMPILSITLLLFIPHELIHGITWMIVAKCKWSDIKFGVMWKKFCTPYCHCKISMTVSQYRLALLMPLIVLGILPSLLSLVIGSSLLLFYGILGTVSAVGDIMMAWLLRKESSIAKIYDHPSAAAFFLFDTDEDFKAIKEEISNLH
jgi:hypothetical protein